ncbi:MAG: UvrD-helicase domain-containing protein [Nocardioides sp.]|nr:UvrD-helicase domain-containing protein [Nocardioides sp.]
MRPFDLYGPLPTGATTTVLEASAGTGKTFTLAGLVTLYVAEGEATLDQMLLITFGRAASQELRERVREQLVVGCRALEDPTLPAASRLVEHLRRGSAEQVTRRRLLLRDALAGFDAATIATTHQFCQLVLRSLGVAGDTDAGVTLVESLDEVVTEIVDDLYLQRFAHERDAPGLTRSQALGLARDVVGNPGATLTPEQPDAGSAAEVRVRFAQDVLAELERRKRRMGILGYDDLLSRLAHALAAADAPARDRMRARWRIVMVDEFQDTDPVQWDVIERAFVGHSTVVLIGDPKQAIYAFRGGDIVTYLRARRAADQHWTLDVNHRSDAVLVERLQSVLLGAALGHDEIVVHPVTAENPGHRLVGAPHGDPFRLRVVTREKFGLTSGTVKMEDLRPWVARDLATDVKALLASGATWAGRPLQAGDVAVIVEAHRDARACRDALAELGVPAVYTGDQDVFASAAAADWLCLLEAFEQPHRSGLVRAAALTRFFGESASTLAAGGDAVTDRVAETIRSWTDHARERGVAAVFEAAMAAGMGPRVLAWRGGERDMTDLSHLAQVLHETAHREGYGLPALLDWLRTQCRERNGAAERNRRLDSDAAAVQVMTVWVSKGLQYPVVYLPFAFNRHVPSREVVLHHRDDERCLDIGGKRAGFAQVEALGRREMAGDDIRLTYVALTRAQSQVVAWWAPTWDEPNGGLSRLLRGRVRDQAEVPDHASEKVSDAEALAAFRAWQQVGGPRVEQALPVQAPALVPAGRAGRLAVRRFDRAIDTDWKRTSYSGLVRAAEQARGVTSEPEQPVLDDELDDDSDDGTDPPQARLPRDGALASPMADLPAGAGFGSLVHGVLETADPSAPDLLAELTAQVAEHRQWWPVEAGTNELAEALVPMHHTPLGPLVPGLTLGGIGLGDRLRELDFEIPLSGGDRAPGASVTLADVGALLRAHLAPDDPVLPYADRLAEPGLGGQPLRGYLSGSIDVVLRVPGPDGEPRYLVVDYKTNRLGERERPLSADDYSRERVLAAMLHSDYPLQALLYVVVAHRYLRWRQPGYDPGRHLGGVLYLYVRGMCGPDTPLEDGHPAGVFSWVPPPSLVLALSDLLDGRRPR